jgi:hypothetical protein
MARVVVKHNYDECCVFVHLVNVVSTPPFVFAGLVPPCVVLSYCECG